MRSFPFHVGLRGSLCLLLLVGSATGAKLSAAIIDIPTLAASKYASSGQHNYPFDTNYLVGNIPFVGTYRNYFAFDMAALPNNQLVTAATLLVDQPNLGHMSPDASELYQLFDVATPLSTIQVFRSPGDVFGIAVYDDLGTGTVLGSVTLGESSEETLVSIALNAAALQILNNAGTKQIALGGALASLLHSPDEDERTFGFSGDTSRHFLRLTTVTIPEPSSWLLACLALGFTFWTAMMRRRGTLFD